MISLKDIARCALVPGALVPGKTFELWENLVLQLRPDLSGTKGPHSVKAALSGFQCINIPSVPDIDQQWSALPNGGKMYCHPTSALNWMQYLAQHREPSADSPSDPVTDRLQIMADYMDVDPDCGTDTDDAVEGIVDWCDDRNVPLVVAAVDFNPDVPIPFEDLESTMLFGGLINLRIGRYKWVDGEYQREGGHAATLVGLEQVAGQLALHVHDPNDETADLQTQSQTNTRRQPVTAVEVTLDGERGWVLRYSPDQFIVGFIAILPMYLLTDASSNTVALDQASWDSLSVSRTLFRVPFSGSITDIASHPGRPMASVLDGQSGEIWNLDLGRKAWTHFATVPGARRMAYHGRSQVLAVFTSSSLTVLNADGKTAQTRPLDVDIDDAAYDFRSDMLLAASSTSGRILCFTSDLQSRIELAGLVPRGRGRVLLHLDARQRRLTVSRADSAEIMSTVLPWGQRERPNVTRVRRRDELRPARYVVQRGEVVAQRSDGVRFEGAALDGIRGHSILRLAQTTHNVNPRHTGTFKWRDQGLTKVADTPTESTLHDSES